MKYQLKQCPLCTTPPETIELDELKVEEWRSGNLIQMVWPEMTPDERELLITGIHPSCWDKTFAETEDDLKGNNL